MVESSPKWLHLYTNNQCNLKCQWCNTHDRRKSRPVPDMDVAMLRRILNTFPTLQKAWVGAPGEPMLLEGIGDLIKTLKLEAHLTVHVTTNGTLVANRPDAQWDMVDAVAVSLLETTRETYKDITGVDRFDAALRGIRFLKMRRVPRIMVAFTITRKNIWRIPNYIELGRKVGADAVILRSLCWVEGQELAHFRDDLALHTEVEGLQMKLALMKGQAPKDIEVQWPHIPDFSKERPFRCFAARELLAVDGAGNIACCCRGPGPRAEMGNISQGPKCWAEGPIDELRQLTQGPSDGWPVKCQSCYVPYEVAP